MARRRGRRHRRAGARGGYLADGEVVRGRCCGALGHATLGDAAAAGEQLGRRRQEGRGAGRDGAAHQAARHRRVGQEAGAAEQAAAQLGARGAARLRLTVRRSLQATCNERRVEVLKAEVLDSGENC